MDKHWTSTPNARALVTGATGMVGRALLASLGGHAVVTTRDVSKLEGGRALPGASEVVFWDAVSPLGDRALEDVEAVFHLAGEPVAEGRWTEAKKERIFRSRVDSTRALVASIAARPSSKRPRVLVSASAVGIYGSRGDDVLDEESRAADGFLADVCRAWEGEALRARDLGVRVVTPRIGIVLSPHGGALAKMLTPFKLGAGAKLGDGRQWMPWIHIDDLVSLLRFSAQDHAPTFEGAVNAVAPGVVTNAHFTTALARTLHRPALFSAPAIALRAALGEAAGVVLASQRVTPRRARQAGFVFAHPEIEGALAHLVGRERSSSALREEHAA